MRPSAGQRGGAGRTPAQASACKVPRRGGGGDGGGGEWASARRRAGKSVSTPSPPGPGNIYGLPEGRRGRRRGHDCLAGGMRRALGFPAVPGGGLARVESGPGPPTSGPVRSRLGGNRSLESESPQLFPSTPAGRGGTEGPDGGGKEPGEGGRCGALRATGVSRPRVTWPISQAENRGSPETEPGRVVLTPGSVL